MDLFKRCLARQAWDCARLEVGCEQLLAWKANKQRSLAWPSGEENVKGQDMGENGTILM